MKISSTVFERLSERVHQKVNNPGNTNLPNNNEHFNIRKGRRYVFFDTKTGNIVLQ